MNMFRSIIKKIENNNIPLINYVITFFVIIFLRILIELTLTEIQITTDAVIHLSFFYISIFLSIIIALHLLTKTPIHNVSKGGVIAFSVLPLAPLFDLLLLGPNRPRPTYLLPHIHDNIIQRFFSFGGNTEKYGITIGLKIQIILLLVFASVYIYSKQKKIISTILSAIAIYGIMFTYMSIPFFIFPVQEFFGITPEVSQMVFFQFFAILIFFQGMYLWFKTDRFYFKAILKDTRPILILLHMVFIGIGFLLRLHNPNNPLQISNSMIFYFPLLGISIFFAALFSIITNNIEDKKIDEIVHQNRPHINKTLNFSKYYKIGFVSLLLSLLFASFINSTTFLLIVLLNGFYFFYSLPPFKLKRVFFVSKIIFSFNYIIMILLGYNIDNNNFEYIPIKFLIYFGIFFFLVHHYRDLRDFKGDLKEKIPTFSVFFGLKKSKIIVMFFIGLAYALSYSITNNKLVLTFLGLLWLLQIVIIRKINFKEHIFTIINIIAIISISASFMISHDNEQINHLDNLADYNDYSNNLNNRIQQNDSLKNSISNAINGLKLLQDKENKFESFTCNENEPTNCFKENATFPTIITLDVLSHINLSSFNYKELDSLTKTAATFIFHEFRNNTLNYLAKSDYRTLEDDVDDTALGSIILLQYLHTPIYNKELLLKNKDIQGIFQTWLNPEKINENDIDPVVNANVVRYLESYDEAPCTYIKQSIKKELRNSLYYPEMFGLFMIALGTKSDSCLQSMTQEINEILDNNKDKLTSSKQDYILYYATKKILQESKITNPDVKQKIIENQEEDGNWGNFIHAFGHDLFFKSKSIITAAALFVLVDY